MASTSVRANCQQFDGDALSTVETVAVAAPTRRAPTQSRSTAMLYEAHMDDEDDDGVDAAPPRAALPAAAASAGGPPPPARREQAEYASE